MRNENFLSEMIKQFWLTGSDKQYWHNYSVGYYNLLRDKSISNLLEIGILNGSSIRAWKNIFPSASIYGIDINPNYMMSEPGIITDIVDQSSVFSLQNYMRKVRTKFDLIVDDGSHIFAHAKTSFDVLFDHLEDDGIYIIEDVSSVYAEIDGPGWRLPQQLIGDWTNYLNTFDGIDYKLIDCHYGNPNYPASWMIGITKKK